ncbi:zinc knuckle domain-containing protein [Colletotrichum truncatum]|uniref:Zinc knuckle domain-containing protein n=1 Tax=Colletotrichum truncatum TaxID=5467 RepID=A0ACC3ZDN6_COLTU|nr:zinc knuckle domain-containing protein [Colletotrichum truncatum]KAF6794782.1 zinc knuckle domain-containing protein [Colletotrichum truncatum]
MEASDQIEGLPAAGEVAETVEAVAAQRPSKKRSLEDVQRDAEPDASEPHQASSPEPEAKRAKTNGTDKNEAADEPEKEESAEEGELEEDGEVSQSSISGSEEMGDRATPSSASDDKSDAGSKRSTRSMSAAAKAPAHVGWNQGITSQIRTSLGGSAKASPALVKAKSKEATPTPESAPATEVAPPQVPAPAPAPSTEPAQNTKQTRQERRQEKLAQAATEKQKTQEDQKKPFEYAPGLSFFLPNKRTILQPKGNNLGTGVWKSKFKSWCQSFISRNIEQKDQLNADIVVAALQEYIATRAQWSKKKHGIVAAAEAKKPQVKNDIAVNLATILKSDDYLNTSTGTGTEESPMVIYDDDDDPEEASSSSGKPGSGGTQVANKAGHEQSEGAQQVPSDNSEHSHDESADEGEADSGRPGPAVMTEEEDLAQQRKYFPGLSETDQICVYCATLGHTSSSCPKTACRFCEVPHHFSWNCPTRERCTKCRQLGHGKGQCTEKLIHLDEEGAECATCGSQDHSDTECEALWRSYKPRKGAIKKVNTLPAFCAFCGSEGHYSSDCALGSDKPPNQTWTLKNRDQYLDKNAADGPISDFASVPQPPQLQIKGSAAKRNHIFYPDSDGSEEGEFIGQKVKPRAPVGNIQMSTNIQFGNFGAPPSQPQQNGRGQQRGGWSAQPPLPPGPPPPGPPPPGSYSRMSKSYNNQSRPPPPSNGIGRSGLPPKPPAPQHGYHSVAPPPNGPGPNARRQRGRQPGNPPTGPANQQNGGGSAGRRRGKNRRGGKQG